MKVPIQSKDDMPKTKGSDAAAPSDDMAESTAAEVDSEAEERAHIEAAIRAGEEAAEKELAADAGKIRAERDELQKKLDASKKLEGTLANELEVQTTILADEKKTRPADDQYIVRLEKEVNTLQKNLDKLRDGSTQLAQIDQRLSV